MAALAEPQRVVGPQQRIIGPQPGPQTAFLSSSADIVIYGGAAGGGKSYALLLEPLRHVHNPDFGGVIFRRTFKQVTNEGGLWDESMKLYPLAGGKPMLGDLSWRFVPPGSNSGAGASISFAHLNAESTVLEFQGSQIPFIGFDELTHFTDYQFWYMLSRNRSSTGIRGYVRATTNPDADSWVAKLIQWWWDPETGYAIHERSGVIRWFVRLNDEITWADTREELLERFGKLRGPDGLPLIGPSGEEIKSLTFIAAKLEDNAALLAKDPSYRGNLLAQGSVEMERLLRGNWKVKKAGKLFKREWFEVVRALPATVSMWARGWDLAATEQEDGKDPDFTAGVKMGKDVAPDGKFYITNAVRGQLSPNGSKMLIVNTASQDRASTPAIINRLPVDPGAGGKAWTGSLVLALAGHRVKSVPPTGDKATRASPLADQAEAGNVKILATGDPAKDAWIEPFLDELCNFPGKAHDDQVDAAADAFNELALGFGPAVVRPMGR